jgi:hypothetical protein
MRFGTWNVRSLYRAGSLKTVSRELARYKLDLVGVQEVRWEGDGTEPAYATKYFLVLDFIVHFSHYMFLPCLAAIFRWLANTKSISKAVTIYSKDPLSRRV